MPKKVSFKGSPLNLVGRDLKEGDVAPSFRAVGGNLGEVTLLDFKDKIKVITSFPSLDTPVCNLQIKEFNKQAADFSPDTAIIGISKDLPFAQRRFCQTHSIEKVTLLSDYKFSSFGINYGLLIKEWNLLSRAVIIVDKSNILRYRQIVEELTNEPNYTDALANLKKVIEEPHSQGGQSSAGQCKPCEGGILPLAEKDIARLIAQHRGWEVIDNKKLKKEFKFNDFSEAKYYLDLIANIAQEQGHHPTLTIIYNKLRVTLTTHIAGGLTENDFIMAEIIDQLGVGNEKNSGIS